MAVPQHPAENERFDEELDVDALTRAPLDTMPHGSFSSSNVHSGIYDFGERELYMRYLRDAGSDAIYKYLNVPAQIWSGLVEADSKGSYVNANIAFEYTYGKFGRGDLPERSAIGNDFVRQFFHSP